MSDVTHVMPSDLARALVLARSLNSRGEVNSEYARGQAELICDMFGLSLMDNKDEVIDFITHGTRHLTLVLDFANDAIVGAAQAWVDE